MPLRNWNGKFAGVGNGGWAGTISFGALAEQTPALLCERLDEYRPRGGARRGRGPIRLRASGATDRLRLSRASRNDVERESAPASVLRERSSEHSYWIGCSSGGYEGLMEAQRFPADYDGIVAGAPANNWTRLMAGDLDAMLAVLQDSASTLSPSALGMLYRAVLAACDSADGVVDGVLEDPRRCKFDPAALQCAENQMPGACLTPAQVEAARRIYRGLKDPMTGAQLYPGLAPGSEPFWTNRDAANPFTIPIAHYRWLVFADPNWNWSSFQFTDPAGYQAFLRAESKFAPLLNATNPNLQEFRQRGGKLLQYHGWNDQLIAPQNSIDYYESVISFFGGGKDRTVATAEVQSFYRLFMAPGMAHCERRNWSELIRHAGCSGTVGGTWIRARSDHCLALHQWCGRPVAPPLSLPEGCDVQREGRYERRDELRLSGS